MKASGWFVLAALVVVAALLSTRRDKPRKDAEKSEITAVRESFEPPPVRPDRVTILPVAESAAALNSPETTVQDDLLTLDLLLSEYRKFSGGNPVGANDEITAALLGKNAKSIAFIDPGAAPVDGEGQLIDRWGTPYFFHAISAEHMEIISAGPDMRQHTEDDIIAE